MTYRPTPPVPVVLLDRLGIHRLARQFNGHLKSFDLMRSNNVSERFTWPTGYGTSGQFLQTDGAGALSWATVAAGEWTDQGAYLEPNTDGDYIHINDSGGSFFSRLDYDELILRDNAGAHMKVSFNGTDLKFGSDSDDDMMFLRRSNGRLSLGTTTNNGVLNIGSDRILGFFGTAGGLAQINHSAGNLRIQVGSSRYIDLDTVEVRIDGFSSSGMINMQIDAAAGDGIVIKEHSGGSGTGYPLQLLDSSGNALPGSIGPGGAFTIEDAVDVGMSECAQFYHDSTVATSIGVGAKIGFYADNSGNTKYPMGYVGFDSQDITGFHTGNFVVQVVDNVASAGTEVLRIDEAGLVNVPVSGALLSLNGTQVLQERITGWTAATGTATRSGFATSTATTQNVAEALKALIDDLITHGVIGA